MIENIKENMNEDFSIKGNMDVDFNIKRGKKKKKHYCPYCGHAMKVKVLNGFRYCNVCHEQLPGFASTNDFDKPIKEIKL